MSGLQPSVVEQDRADDRARQVDETFAKLREEVPPFEFLHALLRAFGEVREECRVKEQFYRCRGQRELAMRFDNASRAALGALAAIPVAFDYEHEELIRQQIARESEAAAKQV